MMTCQRALQSLSQSHRFLWRSALDVTTGHSSSGDESKSEEDRRRHHLAQIKDAVSKVLSALGKKK
jgi:hypothetical protein